MSLPLTTSSGRMAPRFRLGRVPAGLGQFFRPLSPRLHGDHYEYFRLLVLALAVA